MRVQTRLWNGHIGNAIGWSNQRSKFIHPTERRGNGNGHRRPARIGDNDDAHRTTTAATTAATTTFAVADVREAKPSRPQVPPEVKQKEPDR